MNGKETGKRAGVKGAGMERELKQEKVWARGREAVKSEDLKQENGWERETGRKRETGQECAKGEGDRIQESRCETGN